MKIGHKELFAVIISIVLLTDLAILLNIPFLRQILGFLFLAILPGLLILQILKLDETELVEKIVFSVGLSISFLMFFGLLINTTSLSIGYETPLSTNFFLISINIAFIALAIAGYNINKNSIFFHLNLNLTKPEKVFLVVPILFPALSILGTHLMKTADNNAILMLLLFLIPLYVVFVCFFNHKFTKRLYPAVIFLISVSLLLIFVLRFPHICGHDVHTEYGVYFQTTLDSLHWSVFSHSALDACLSISLLPTIFQAILNVDAQEYLFKGIYVSICSFGPLAIYVISKKYIDELYAFLASFFFISQSTFLSVAGSPRTNVAIFFVALTVMVFFSNKIEPMKRKILLIVFMFSMVVSHYSTTYIFIFVLLFSWFVIKIFSIRYIFKKNITLRIIMLLFIFIFIWYSQITETTFSHGVRFVRDTVTELNNFFVEESRAPQFRQLFGEELAYPVLSRVNVAVTWCTFILMGIGVLAMLKRYKEMVIISKINLKKPDFLKEKFEMDYSAMVMTCSGLLVVMVVVPYVSVGYGIQRVYSLAIVIMSVCFVMGGIILSKHLKIQAYLIILLILIPYFLFATGAMYQICGAPVSYTLNSEGEGYDIEYLHDRESYAAKWIEESEGGNFQINTADWHGKRKLISQSKIPPDRISYYNFFNHHKIKGYIYLSYNNAINGKLAEKDELYNMSEFSDAFIGKSKIYNNGGSEIWN